MRPIVRTACLLLLTFIIRPPASATTVDAGFYFDLSNALIDLPYPGTEFYGEVDLTLLGLNNLLVGVNPYESPGEYDAFGNFISSPLVAGPNFGVQQFGMNSTLIDTKDDFETFIALYDVVLPEGWKLDWTGTAGEFGRFELWFKGTGYARLDPLSIEIIPKVGAVIPLGFSIDSVYDFVEQGPRGPLFAAHIADFTTQPLYWKSGPANPQSAYFAAGPPIIPEPSLTALSLLGGACVGLLSRRRKRIQYR